MIEHSTITTFVRVLQAILNNLIFLKYIFILSVNQKCLTFLWLHNCSCIGCSLSWHYLPNVVQERNTVRSIWLKASLIQGKSFQYVCLLSFQFYSKSTSFADGIRMCHTLFSVLFIFFYYKYNCVCNFILQSASWVMYFHITFAFYW